MLVYIPICPVYHYCSYWTYMFEYRVNTAEPGRQEIRPGSVFLHKNWV